MGKNRLGNISVPLSWVDKTLSEPQVEEVAKSLRPNESAMLLLLHNGQEYANPLKEFKRAASEDQEISKKKVKKTIKRLEEKKLVGADKRVILITPDGKSVVKALSGEMRE